MTKELDKLLDRALEEYCDVSPRPGLESRVLAGLEERKRKAKVRWWAAIPVVAALLVIAVLLGIRSARPKQQVVKTQLPAKIVQSTAKASIAKTQDPPLRQTGRKTLRPALPEEQRTGEPRLNTFPARSDDDELVRLAVRFVQTQPAMAAQITQEQNDFRQLAEAFTAPLHESDEQEFSEER